MMEKAGLPFAPIRRTKDLLDDEHLLQTGGLAAMVLPHGPERDRVFEQAKRLSVAYAPYKVHVHRIQADLQHPHVLGYRRPLFWQEWWHMVDLLPAEHPAA